MRIRLDGEEQWCERRLLARIQRYTLETLRERIRPVSEQDWLAFLAEWQHVAPGSQLEGPEGVREVIRQLAGVEAPAPEWERNILPARVKDYRPEWLDRLTLTGEVAWGRLWGSANSAPRSTPIALLPREDLSAWLELAPSANPEKLPWPAKQIEEYLERRGATFADELQRELRMLPSHLDEGLAALVAHGMITNDAFAALRKLIVPSRKRGARPMRKVAAGRWSRLRRASEPSPASARLWRAPETRSNTTQDADSRESDGANPIAHDHDPLTVTSLPEEARPRRALPGEALPERGPVSPDSIDHCAHQLLLRYGVVFRRAIEKERLPIPWRDLLRAYRRMELRGEIRGGRFVGGAFTGEQYALPRAVAQLRKRREGGAFASLPETLSPKDPCALLAEAVIAPTRNG